MKWLPTLFRRKQVEISPPARQPKSPVPYRDPGLPTEVGEHDAGLDLSRPVGPALRTTLRNKAHRKVVESERRLVDEYAGLQDAMARTYRSVVEKEKARQEWRQFDPDEEARKVRRRYEAEDLQSADELDEVRHRIALRQQQREEERKVLKRQHKMANLQYKTEREGLKPAPPAEAPAASLSASEKLDQLLQDIAKGPGTTTDKLAVIRGLEEKYGDRLTPGQREQIEFFRDLIAETESREPDL